MYLFGVLFSITITLSIQVRHHIHMFVNILLMVIQQLIRLGFVKIQHIHFEVEFAIVFVLVSYHYLIMVHLLKKDHHEMLIHPTYYQIVTCIHLQHLYHVVYIIISS